MTVTFRSRPAGAGRWRPWLVLLVTIAAACGRSGPPRLESYTSAPFGYTIPRPASWHQVADDGDRRLWFLPQPLSSGQTPEGTATDFIVIMTHDGPGPLPESDVRRLALSLLPMHGVSGFQRTAQSTDQVAWYRFELTGATAGREWASVGLLVTGPARLHYVVCAGALERWRTQQKLCDDVLRGFTPGDLTK